MITEELSRSGLLGPREAGQFVRTGHFAYESGDHGDTWLALELLFGEPRRLQRVAAQLARALVPYKADLVCAPLIGGALVGQWIACELGVRFVFAEQRPDPSGRRYVIPGELRRGVSGSRAVVVDDVINAGSATLACVQEIQSAAGRVVALASLIIREGAALDIQERVGIPVEALIAVRWNMWTSADCPLCQSGVELGPTPS
jgi:orotate phosphoribosyltransferase